MQKTISFQTMLLLAGLLCFWLSSEVQATDRVVVIPMGNHGAPVTKTGQATKSVAGDDGG